MSLEEIGRNTFSIPKMAELVGAIQNIAVSQLDLMPIGLVDTTNTTFFKLKTGTSFVYHGSNANITAVFSKNGTIDTGATQPTTDVTIDGVSALAAPIANSGTDDTEVAGVLSAAVALVEGDVIELDVVKGTNSDADNMHVVIKIQTQ